MQKYAWPLGIVVVMAAFIAMTLTFVKRAFSERVDLVANDYYYRDKDFSQRLEQEKALGKLGESSIRRDADKILVTLPAHFKGRQVKGTLQFYSPLNPADDFNLPLEFTGLSGATPAKLKPNQIWKVSFAFEADKARYFLQATLK